MPEQHERKTERRPVRSDDPSLSPAANRLLTQELREAIGRDEVVVPAGGHDPGRDEHAGDSTGAATVASNRPLIIVTFIGALVVGGIIALVTGQYWAVLVAAALHAIGTLIVAGGALHLTTETEHVSPTVAARLEEEGVADPDRVLSELVEDYTHEAREARDTRDSGAGREAQRGAGSGSAVEALVWWVIGGLSLACVVIALVVGGDMWALPAIVLPLCAGWIALQYRLARGGAGAAAAADRSPQDAEGAARPMLPVAVFVVAGVIWFMAVVGWIGDLL
jgi:hypothetical protein